MHTAWVIKGFHPTTHTHTHTNCVGDQYFVDGMVQMEFIRIHIHGRVFAQAGLRECGRRSIAITAIAPAKGGGSQTPPHHCFLALHLIIWLYAYGVSVLFRSCRILRSNRNRAVHADWARPPNVSLRSRPSCSSFEATCIPFGLPAAVANLARDPYSRESAQERTNSIGCFAHHPKTGLRRTAGASSTTPPRSGRGPMFAVRSPSAMVLKRCVRCSCGMLVAVVAADWRTYHASLPPHTTTRCGSNPRSQCLCWLGNCMAIIR